MVTPRRLAVAIVNMYKECRPCYWPEGEHCVEAACPSKSTPLTISSITLKLRSFRANFDAPAASFIIMRSVARVGAASSVRVHNALWKREREWAAAVIIVTTATVQSSLQYQLSRG